MLIDDRNPGSPRPGPSPWEPNWRMWRWVAAAAVVAFAAASVSGGVAAMLAITAFGLACRALDEAIPYGQGLREWRQ